MSSPPRSYPQQRQPPRRLGQPRAGPVAPAELRLVERAPSLHSTRASITTASERSRQRDDAESGVRRGGARAGRMRKSCSATGVTFSVHAKSRMPGAVGCRRLPPYGRTCRSERSPAGRPTRSRWFANTTRFNMAFPLLLAVEARPRDPFGGARERTPRIGLDRDAGTGRR